MTQPGGLDAALTQVERHLCTLGDALRRHEADALAGEAAALQRALAAVLRERSRSAALSPALRQRLARAASQVAAQREALARAGAALGRAVDVLLPGAPAQVAYSAAGLGERPVHGGLLRA